MQHSQSFRKSTRKVFLVILPILFIMSMTRAYSTINLKEAIQIANLNAGVDTISLDNFDVYSLIGNNAELIITDDLVLISGDNLENLFSDFEITLHINKNISVELIGFHFGLQNNLIATQIINQGELIFKSCLFASKELIGKLPANGGLLSLRNSAITHQGKLTFLEDKTYASLSHQKLKNVQEISTSSFKGNYIGGSKN